MKLNFERFSTPEFVAGNAEFEPDRHEMLVAACAVLMALLTVAAIATLMGMA